MNKVAAVVAVILFVAMITALGIRMASNYVNSHDVNQVNQLIDKTK